MHPAYNQAIVNSLGQQMLLNLVRLRYRDIPYFLEVGSVTASLSLDTTVGVGADIDLGAGSDFLKPNLGVTYSQRPTISYAPLQGKDLLQRIFSPISIDALLAMTQSGWSIERVFGLCIERLNDLANAPGASGPTPDYVPPYRRFKRLLALLRHLQLEDRILMGLDPATQHLIVQITPDPSHPEILEELRTLLGITEEQTIYRFEINTNILEPKNQQWDVRVRSISSVLFYLSQNIEIPEEHRMAGLVTLTKTADGRLFDWGETPGGMMFRVRSSRERPVNAFLAVPYRGAWFYIADDDLQSKSSFLLLQQLFRLQAGQVIHPAPTLTLPVGGQ
ncbi:MAG: hypothetical protein D6690_02100 [Nitrospirae bacterium]|nr:MAG: hypothetical protein D6690_02100 [Nitrospirota bacterium]